MTRCLASFLVALCLCPVLSAKEIAVGPQGVSAFLDSEVSTNIAFSAGGSGVRSFDVRVELTSSVSNCVQVAFGRDSDGDGDLAPEETALVLGWRSGRGFVEDVAGEDRRFGPETAADGGPRSLHMHVALDKSLRPVRATFEDGSGACFEDIAAACPPWLFDADWNLLKATRRGVSEAGEMCRIRSDCGAFRLVLR